MAFTIVADGGALQALNKQRVDLGEDKIDFLTLPDLVRQRLEEVYGEKVEITKRIFCSVDFDKSESFHRKLSTQWDLELFPREETLTGTSQEHQFNGYMAFTLGAQTHSELVIISPEVTLVPFVKIANKSCEVLQAWWGRPAGLAYAKGADHFLELL